MRVAIFGHVVKMILIRGNQTAKGHLMGKDLNLNPSYFDSSRPLITGSGDLNACINAFGLYNSFQFVLRLSPLVHAKVSSLPEGIASNLDFDDLQAYSTFLHETIHWWQHVGSTTGLLLSLSYPAQTHANYGHLTDYLKTIGPQKSILQVADLLTRKGKKTPNYNLANTIVNNHFDIEFCRALLNTPSKIDEILESPYFECVGHSYQITLGNTLRILMDTLDQANGVLPDPEKWDAPFQKLRDQKWKGFYYGSEVTVSPIGAYEIFEGQARFAQLQFLFFGSGKRLTWDDVRPIGMLAGVYVKAFEAFLKLSGLNWPSSIDHPTVGLFLLVCDISINSGVGFPFPIQVFKAFTDDIDPGMRFLMLCSEIRKQPELGEEIKNYSREEYESVSEKLTKPLFLCSPISISQKVGGWIEESAHISNLMEEHRTFQYVKVNLPVRVLFSHFLSFNRDKAERPEFFCWPGVWCAGDRVTKGGLDIFNRHMALFVDKEDDDGIFPRIPDGKNKKDVHDTFNAFYSNNVAYDMTRQWIIQSGPFDYSYRWLSTKQEFDSKKYADHAFESAFKMWPDEMILI